MNIRKHFPILETKMSERKLVYFDNAATTQKPYQVIDAVNDFYLKKNANVHRSLNPLAEAATISFEDARYKISEFIGAESWREVIFTSGATAGINLVAQSWGRKNLKRGDRVVLTICEHHSNIVPWLQLKEEREIEISFIALDADGGLDMQKARELIEHKKTKLVSFQLVSNALGVVHPYQELIRLAKSVDALVLIDGAQAMSHMKIDVRNLGCDFFVFSGHKMFAPTGIGVLWSKTEHLEKMRPWQGGGEMIREVFIDGFTVNHLPYKFEAGTPNIADAIGLGSAVDFLNIEAKIGAVDFYAHERKLTEALYFALKSLDFVTVYGHGDMNARTPTVAFTVKDMHAHDVGDLLGLEGVAVRSGHHCAQPLHDFLGIPATTRASLALYNTLDEIEVFIVALEGVYARFMK